MVKILLIVACMAIRTLETWASPELESMIMRARLAIDEGSVVPSQHLQPLLDSLRTASEDQQQRLINAISDLGRADGRSPASVKVYYAEQAPAALFAVFDRAGSHTLRADALMALRDLGVARPVVEEAIRRAEADRHEFVRSRADILRGYLKVAPAAAPAAAAIKPLDPAREQAAREWLLKRNKQISPATLRLEAQNGNVEAVQALLDAGVPPNTSDPMQGPLHAAIQSGCAIKGADNPLIVQTVETLLARGADPNATYANGGTVLFFAAQMCGPQVMQKLLDAGGDPNAANAAGLTPLGMALLTRKLEIAEALIRKGATLHEKQIGMLGGVSGDPAVAKLIEKARR